MKNGEFFDVMKQLVEESTPELREEHITIQRFQQAAREAGRTMRYNAALQLLRKKEADGVLRYVGQLRHPVSGRLVNAWEGVKKRGK